MLTLRAALPPVRPRVASGVAQKSRGDAVATGVARPTRAAPSLVQHGRGLLGAGAGAPGTARREADVRVHAEAAGKSRLGEAGRTNLRRAAESLRRLGWVAFWSQLALCIVSIVITIFSIAFTRETSQNLTLGFTMFGIVAGTVSVFWAFGYTRLSRTLFRFLASLEGSRVTGDVREVTREDVTSRLTFGSLINILGCGSTLLGLQATVGLLVAKTLTSATTNPFLAGAQGSWSPVLALDVFLVQACTNTVLSHFVSLTINLWLLRIINTGVGIPPSTAQAQAKAA